MSGQRDSNATTVLLVEDEETVSEFIAMGLGYEGFAVETVRDGRDALAAFERFRPDIVLLDLMLPGMDGMTVCRTLRARSDVPIIMLTARDAVEDRVAGLDSGADDYLVKPFAPQELLARIRALLRRVESPNAPRALSFADLRLDPTTRETTRGERRFELSPKEFDLLSYLLRHPRQVLPRARILEVVWGEDFYGDDNVLDVYIGYLRQKTEADGEPRLIQTVRGVGYVIRE